MMQLGWLNLRGGHVTGGSEQEEEHQDPRKGIRGSSAVLEEVEQQQPSASPSTGVHLLTFPLLSRLFLAGLFFATRVFSTYLNTHLMSSTTVSNSSLKLSLCNAKNHHPIDRRRTENLLLPLFASDDQLVFSLTPRDEQGYTPENQRF